MEESRFLKTFNVDIDVKRPVAIRPFELVEGDTGNRINIRVTDDGAEADLDDCFVTAVFSNSAGISVQDSGHDSVTVSGNTVTIDVDPASFAPGMVECELQIYSASEGVPAGIEDCDVLVTTAKFNFSCRRAILNGETIELTPQLPILTEIATSIEQAETAREQAEAARAAAEADRQSEESTRASREIQRRSNETARQSNETARVAAEAERQALLTAHLASCGQGVLTGSADPSPSTEGDPGRLRFSSESGDLFLCTAAHEAVGDVPAYREWAVMEKRSAWRKIAETTLALDSVGVEFTADQSNAPFSFDELRLTYVGTMEGGTSVSVFLNGHTDKKMSFSTFGNLSSANLAHSMTALYFQKPIEGFAICTKLIGGETSEGSAGSKGVQSNIFGRSGFTGYTAVKLVCSGSNTLFSDGGKFILEGRDIP